VIALHDRQSLVLPWTATARIDLDAPTTIESSYKTPFARYG
jgi:hypothetical protein